MDEDQSKLSYNRLHEEIAVIGDSFGILRNGLSSEVRNHRDSHQSDKGHIQEGNGVITDKLLKTVVPPYSRNSIYFQKTLAWMSFYGEPIFIVQSQYQEIFLALVDYLEHTLILSKY
ncbi:hypothetical protein ACTA71_009354 [Dictyostelium dimigraforme]